MGTGEGDEGKVKAMGGMGEDVEGGIWPTHPKILSVEPPMA